MCNNLNNRIDRLRSTVNEINTLFSIPENKAALTGYHAYVYGMLEEINGIIGSDVKPDIKVLDHFIIQMDVAWKHAMQLINSKLGQTRTVLAEYLTALTESRRLRLAASPVAFLSDVILLNLEIDRIQKILTNIKANTYIQLELDVIAQLTKLINEDM